MSLGFLKAYLRAPVTPRTSQHYHIGEFKGGHRPPLYWGDYLNLKKKFFQAGRRLVITRRAIYWGLLLSAMNILLFFSLSRSFTATVFALQLVFLELLLRGYRGNEQPFTFWIRKVSGEKVGGREYRGEVIARVSFVATRLFLPICVDAQDDGKGKANNWIFNSPIYMSEDFGVDFFKIVSLSSYVLQTLLCVTSNNVFRGPSSGYSHFFSSSGFLENYSKLEYQWKEENTYKLGIFSIGFLQSRQLLLL